MLTGVLITVERETIVKKKGIEIRKYGIDILGILGTDGIGVMTTLASSPISQYTT